MADPNRVEFYRGAEPDRKRAAGVTLTLSRITCHIIGENTICDEDLTKEISFFIKA